MNNLTIINNRENIPMMNELIGIQTNESQEVIVNGRELHEFLEIKEKYTEWFSRMVEYGFIENQDFALVSEKRETNNPKNPWTTIQNHALKLDMAKELSMVQRTEKGKQARQYFIQIEKDFNSPEKIMARALQYANRQLETLSFTVRAQEQLIGELKPKADYVDRILNNKGLVTITQIAKDYGMSGTAMNKLLHHLGIQYKQGEQWLLYAKHHSKGYTHSETVDIMRKNGTPDVTMNTKWTQKGRLFLYELLKANGHVPEIEKIGRN